VTDASQGGAWPLEQPDWRVAFRAMTFAAAIFLIAAGAILRYAITAHSSVVNLDTLGLILMIVGFAGLILAFVQELIWTDRVDRARRPPEDPRYPPR
jgi:hypothetical protein